jgi:hypothetical protein
MTKLICPKRNHGVHRMFPPASIRLKPTIAALVVLTSSALGSIGHAAPSAEVTAKPEATKTACPALLSRNFNRLQDEAPQSKQLLAAIEKVL